MDDPKLTELHRVVGQHEKLVYEAVKTGMLSELPHEDQFLGRAMQEHMHFQHVHNALEFADLRDGAPYEIMVEGDPVSPLAHVVGHAAVKGQIEQVPLIRAAFEKMIATGCAAHHAEHVLMGMLMELVWKLGQPAAIGRGAEKAEALYLRNLKKLDRDSVYRKKLTRQFGPDHFAFE